MAGKQLADSAAGHDEVEDPEGSEYHDFVME